MPRGIIRGKTKETSEWDKIPEQFLERNQRLKLKRDSKFDRTEFPEHPIEQ